MPRKIEVRRGWLTDDELRILVDRERIPMYRAIWLLMADSGLRTSEVIGLRFGDLVDMPMSRRENHVIVKDHVRIKGKGQVVRYVPLTKRTRQAVNDFVTVNDEVDVHVALVHNNADQFFRCASRTIQHRFQCIRKIAGIAGDHLCPHSLRHSYATRLLSRGIDVLTVSKMMGHRSIHTTMGYLHVCPEAMRRVIEALEDEN